MLLKILLSLILFKSKFYCNLDFRYKTNEKKYEGSSKYANKIIHINFEFLVYF